MAAASTCSPRSLAKILPFDLFETRRLVGAAVGLIGLVVTWRIGRRIGGPLAGADRARPARDLPALLRAHVHQPEGRAVRGRDGAAPARPRARCRGISAALAPTTSCIFGLGLGLSIGSRIMAGMARSSARPRSPARRDRGARRGLRAAALARSAASARADAGAVLAYAVMGLVWPWAVVDPLNPLRAHRIFLALLREAVAGTVRRRADPCPTCRAATCRRCSRCKLPEIFSLLGARRRRWRARRRVPQRRARRARRAMLLPSRLPPCCRRGHGVARGRPCTTASGISSSSCRRSPSLGGLAGAWIARARWRASAALALAAAAVVFAAGVALPVIDMVRLHPYEYAHFNRIAGGVARRRAALHARLLGPRVQAGGARHCASELAERGETPPAGRRWKIAVCGPHPPAQVALGAHIRADLGSQGRGLRADAGRILLRASSTRRCSPRSSATASCLRAPTTCAAVRFRHVTVPPVK